MTESVDSATRKLPSVFKSPRPGFLVIGAGSRGNAYAQAVTISTNGYIAAVAELTPFKRNALGRKYIWCEKIPLPHQAFKDWSNFIEYELSRREAEEGGGSVESGVAGVFICTLDETHAEIITALAPLGLHLMSEKPLATTLNDCLKIFRSLQPPGVRSPTAIFSIGHVLHYSPHNMLLRKLLLEEYAIGEILSMEHTEPVGWWHFSHSYVRGNWRKERTTAPSLLTKSCHDIDLLLWLLCSASISSDCLLHLPSSVMSTGSLLHFKRSRKPDLAGTATNCLSCPAEPECLYSARKIYEDDQLSKGNTGWPISIIDPDIEDLLKEKGKDTATSRLRERLAEDYDMSTPQADVDHRSWFGRCVYESDNDVCDDQIVTMTWEDDPLSSNDGSEAQESLKGRGAKIATFHMVAFTEKQCERRGRIYGTKGEIEYDSKMIRVYDFATKEARTHYPYQPGGGHGGGDTGLARQYVKAVQAVMSGQLSVSEAQRAFIGCTLEDVIRSHAMVFAAEEARRERKVVDWAAWWKANVESIV